jgi:hypothetical protein
MSSDRDDLVHDVTQAYKDSIGHMPNESQCQDIEKVVDDYLKEEK